MSKAEPIALVDLDGTLADFDAAMSERLDATTSPAEKLLPAIQAYIRAGDVAAAVRLSQAPEDDEEVRAVLSRQVITDREWDIPHIKERRRLIKTQPGFWRNLPRLEVGFQVLDLLRKHGFTLNILTKGPLHTTNAWTEKVEWAKEHVPDGAITICTNPEEPTIEGGGKSLVYGKVLFDDWPGYIRPWLKHRPRGFVIMLDHPWNADFEHSNVFCVRRASQRTIEVDLAYLDKKLSEIRKDTGGNG